MKVSQFCPNVVINRPKLLDFSEKKRDRSGSAMYEEDSGQMQIENFKVLDTLGESIEENKMIQSIKNMKRIKKYPYKVLDAPGLQDDFYQVRVE